MEEQKSIQHIFTNQDDQDRILLGKLDSYIPQKQSIDTVKVNSETLSEQSIQKMKNKKKNIFDQNLNNKLRRLTSDTLSQGQINQIMRLDSQGLSEYQSSGLIDLRDNLTPLQSIEESNENIIRQEDGNAQIENDIDNEDELGKTISQEYKISLLKQESDRLINQLKISLIEDANNNVDQKSGRTIWQQSDEQILNLESDNLELQQSVSLNENIDSLTQQSEHKFFNYQSESFSRQVHEDDPNTQQTQKQQDDKIFRSYDNRSQQSEQRESQIIRLDSNSATQQQMVIKFDSVSLTCNQRHIEVVPEDNSPSNTSQNQEGNRFYSRIEEAQTLILIIHRIDSQEEVDSDPQESFINKNNVQIEERDVAEMINNVQDLLIILDLHQLLLKIQRKNNLTGQNNTQNEDLEVLLILYQFKNIQQIVDEFLEDIRNTLIQFSHFSYISAEDERLKEFDSFKQSILKILKPKKSRGELKKIGFFQLTERFQIDENIKLDVKSGQGSISIVQDVIDKKQYVGKVYDDDTIRKGEENILNVIQQDPDFDKYFIKKIGQSIPYGKKKIMIFDQGICDLRTFFRQKYPSRQSNPGVINIGELKYVMNFLLETINFLDKYGIANGDIKLQNIVVVRSPNLREDDQLLDNRYEIRLIDYGSFTIIDSDKFNAKNKNQKMSESEIYPKASTRGYSDEAIVKEVVQLQYQFYGILNRSSSLVLESDRSSQVFSSVEQTIEHQQKIRKLIMKNEICTVIQTLIFILKIYSQSINTDFTSNSLLPQLKKTLYEMIESGTLTDYPSIQKYVDEQELIQFENTLQSRKEMFYLSLKIAENNKNDKLLSKMQWKESLQASNQSQVFAYKFSKSQYQECLYILIQSSQDQNNFMVQLLMKYLLLEKELERALEQKSAQELQNSLKSQLEILKMTFLELILGSKDFRVAFPPLDVNQYMEVFQKQQEQISENLTGLLNHNKPTRFSNHLKIMSSQLLACLSESANILVDVFRFNNIYKNLPFMLQAEREIIRNYYMSRNGADYTSEIEIFLTLHEKVLLDNQNSDLIDEYIVSSIDIEAEMHEVVRLNNMIIQKMLQQNQVLLGELYLTRLGIVLEGNGNLSFGEYIIQVNQFANLLFVSGQVEKAQEYLEKMVVLSGSKVGENTVENIASISNMGSILQKNGKFEEAKECFQKVLGIIESSFGPENAQSVPVLQKLGHLLAQEKNYEQSKRYLEKCLRIQDWYYGKDSLESADTLNELGLVAKDLGEFEKASKYFEREIRIYEKYLGKNRIESANAIQSLGILNVSLNKFDEAKKYFEKSLGLTEKHYGPDNLNSIEILSNLGVLLFKMQEYKESRAYFDRSISIIENHYGKNSINLAERLHNIWVLLTLQNKNEEAKPYLERSLSIYRTHYGENSLNLITILNNIGTFHFKNREYGETRKYYEQALRILESHYGVDHIRCVETLTNLGILLQNEMNFWGSLAMFERVLNIIEKNLGPGSPKSSDILNYLGQLCVNVGKYEEALTYFMRQLEILETHYGKNCFQSADTLRRIGLVLKIQEEYEEAEKYLKRSLIIFGNQNQSQSVVQADILRNLAQIYQKQERLGEARQFFERSLRVKEIRNEKNGTQQAQILHDLGTVSLAQNSPEDAKKYLESSLKVMRGNEADDIEQKVASLHDLGFLHQSQGNFEEAYKYYEQSLEILDRAYGPDSKQSGDTLNNMGASLKSLQRIEEAKRCIERALRIFDTYHGEDSKESADALNNLGLIVLEQGALRNDPTLMLEAKRLMERSLRNIELRLGATSTKSVDTRVNLSVICKCLGKNDEYEKHIRRSIEILDDSMGPNNPRSLQLRSFLEAPPLQGPHPSCPHHGNCGHKHQKQEKIQYTVEQILYQIQELEYQLTLRQSISGGQDEDTATIMIRLAILNFQISELQTSKSLWERAYDYFMDQTEKSRQECVLILYFLTKICEIQGEEGQGQTYQMLLNDILEN